MHSSGLHSHRRDRSLVGTGGHSSQPGDWLFRHGTKEDAVAKRGKVKIPEKLKQNRGKLAEELSRIARDPEVLKRAERVHRQVSSLSAEDLLQQFGC